MNHGIAFSKQNEAKHQVYDLENTKYIYYFFMVSVILYLSKRTFF